MSWIESHLPTPALLEQRFDELFPICRSVTGNGLRQSLEIVKKTIPLKLHEVPAGKKVYDWTVPDEWNIRDAYLAEETGKKWIDFKNNNLHVIAYSGPVDTTMTLDQLQPRLRSIPEMPSAIPYITSY